MKCSACGKSFPVGSWKRVNIGGPTKTTISKGRDPNFISYYALGTTKTNEYNIIYACPHCGTLRVKTPIDKV